MAYTSVPGWVDVTKSYPKIGGVFPEYKPGMVWTNPNTGQVFMAKEYRVGNTTGAPRFAAPGDVLCKMYLSGTPHLVSIDGQATVPLSIGAPAANGWSSFGGILQGVADVTEKLVWVQFSGVGNIRTFTNGGIAAEEILCAPVTELDTTNDDGDMGVFSDIGQTTSELALPVGFSYAADDVNTTAGSILRLKLDTGATTTTPVIGETITGAGGGTATLLNYYVVAATSLYYCIDVTKVNATAFAQDELLTFGTSGATDYALVNGLVTGTGGGCALEAGEYELFAQPA